MIVVTAMAQGGFNSINPSIFHKEQLAQQAKKPTKLNKRTCLAYSLTQLLSHIEAYPRIQMSFFNKETREYLKYFTLVVFYSDVTNKPVEFEGEAATSTMEKLSE